MNLYRVTTASSTGASERTYDVFVLADNETDASRKALAAMEEADYPFTDYAKSIELVASAERYKASSWLIK